MFEKLKPMLKIIRAISEIDYMIVLYKYDNF